MPRKSVPPRFDSCLAQVLALGPLRAEAWSLLPELVEQPHSVTPKGLPVEMVETLAACYFANKPEDSDWVVLPVANFDVYFGTPKLWAEVSETNPGDHFRAIRNRLWTVPVSAGGSYRYSVDKIRHPSPLLPLEMDACSFQNDSVRLPFPTPDGIRR